MNTQNESLAACRADPDFRRTVSADSALPGALSASVLLHAGILLILYTVAMPGRGIALSEEAARPESMVITLVKRQPADPAPVPEQFPAEPVLRKPVAPVVEPPAEPALITGATVEPAQAGTDAAASDVPPNPDSAATVAMIQRSIAGYVQSHRGELNRDYVEDCIRYRNRHGVRECPEQAVDDTAGGEGGKVARAAIDRVFADITRESDDLRLYARLERENQLLADIMDGDSPASEYAANRFYLNRGYQSFLSGNTNAQFNQFLMSSFSNNLNMGVALDAFQFTCADGPCIYQYTGFTPRKPENYVERVSGFTRPSPLFISPD